MLTKDLLSTRIAGKNIVLLFADSSNAKLLDMAQRLICIFENGKGSTAEELEELCNAEIQGFKDLKLARGILKVVRDRAEFSSSGKNGFPEMRKILFEKNFQLLRSGSLPESPAEVRAKVIAALKMESEKKERKETILPEETAYVRQNSASVFSDSGETPGKKEVVNLYEPENEVDPVSLFEESPVYADLPEKDLLTGFKQTFPKEALDRYNIALVQTLILLAGKLECTVYMTEERQRLRRLFKYLKFFRLLFQTRLEKDGRIRLTVDGPASLFENSAKYGFQLACFFPALCQLRRWEMCCEIPWKGQTVKKFSLDQEAGLESGFSHFSAYLPEEIRMFPKLFAAGQPDWTMEEFPDFLCPEGQILVFPDFVFHHVGTGRDFPMELFHRWHAGALEERLKLCERHPEMNLLIGVDRSLLKKDGILKRKLEENPWFQKHGFFFRDFPGAANVSDLLNKQLEQVADVQKDLF